MVCSCVREAIKQLEIGWRSDTMHTGRACVWNHCYSLFYSAVVGVATVVVGATCYFYSTVLDGAVVSVAGS